jgi:hypothetical protein
VCCDVGLVDLDLQVDKRADALFKLILANDKVNLAAVCQGLVFCINVLYDP